MKKDKFETVVLKPFSPQTPKQLCKVDGQYGYFLAWEQYAQPISPSPFMGGPPGGQYAQLFGIVQFEDCVRRVEPTDIVFCDERAATLRDLNERRKEETP